MTEQCAVQGCRLPSEDTHGFCTEHADNIFSQMLWQVQDVLDIASKVYFGRTAFPERRLLEHCAKSGRDHLLIVHWTANWPEAKEFEEVLIREFKEDAKIKRIENESLESEGKFASPWNAIYISFALKQSVPCAPGAITIEHLHWRNRIWPNPVIPNAPVLLRCDLTPEEVIKELARFNEATDPARSRTGRPPTQIVRKNSGKSRSND